MYRLSVGFIALLGVVAVGQVSAETVAMVGGTSITREQLEAHVKPQLIELDTQRYDVLREGLDELIAEELLKQEATTRGMTAEALVSQEVEAKVSEPTTEEIQALFDSNKERLGDATLEQVRERIVGFLKTQKQAAVRETFLGSLKTKHQTSVKLRPPVIEIGEGGRPAKGPANAPVTIIEFSDYECSYCKRAEATVKQVLEAYGDKVRLVYRDYPLPFHANARPASEAAACAEDQGKFWEYQEKLWAASALGEATLKQLAGELGLDQAKFDQCLANKQFTAKVEKDIQDASKVGVNGTPAFFINGRMLSGAQPFEKFKEIIDEELAAAGKSS